MAKRRRRDRKKYAPSSLMLCTVCNNQPPTGKCLICGLACNPNEYVSKWKSRHDFLKQTFDELRMYGQASTGNVQLDEEIREKLGNWLPESFAETMKRLEKFFK